MSHEHCLIRLAEPDETALLADVERRAASWFEHWLTATGLTREILDDVGSVEEFNDAQRRKHLWMAVPPDGVPVGFALVKNVGQAAHLDELDVVPEHTRRDIGSRLLVAVCEWAADAGDPTVTLSTFRDVPWNVPFYQRRRFRVINPEDISSQHVELVRAEKTRGLRTDRRVFMEYRTGIY